MSTPRPKSRFGTLLLEMRLVNEEALAGALAEERATGRRLPRILADRRILDEERMAKAVAARLGLEVVQLEHVRIHPRVIDRIPADLAVESGLLPYAIKRIGDTEVLYLVMSDPLDLASIAEAERASGCQVKVMLSSASALEHAIDVHYRVPPAEGRDRATSAPGRALARTPSHVGARVSAAHNGPRPRDVTVLDPPIARPRDNTVLDDRAPLSEWAGPMDDEPTRNLERVPPARAEQPAAQRNGTAPWLALELPVVHLEEDSHPFEGPSLRDLPVGLGETGIIPELSSKDEPFSPPPPEALSLDRAGLRGLMEGDDIPTSAAAVAARTAAPIHEDDDDIAEIEEVQLEPLEDADLDIEEISDDPETGLLALAGAPGRSEEVRAALTGAAAPRAPSLPEAPTLARLEAERLLSALEAGASMTSADRIRLVLALGRALIGSGVLPRDRLLEELER